MACSKEKSRSWRVLKKSQRLLPCLVRTVRGDRGHSGLSSVKELPFREMDEERRLGQAMKLCSSGRARPVIRHPRRDTEGRGRGVFLWTSGEKYGLVV